MLIFFFFKQKTAYEMRISDWSSDVCSSDLRTSNSTTRSTISAGRRMPQRSCWDEQHGRTHSTDGRKNNGGAPHRQVCPHAGGERSRVGPGRNRSCVPAAQNREEDDRKSVVQGKRVLGRVGIGGRQNIRKKKKTK